MNKQELRRQTAEKVTGQVDMTYSEIIEEIKIRLYEAKARFRYVRKDELIILVPEDYMKTIVRGNLMNGNQIFKATPEKEGVTIFGVRIKPCFIDDIYIALNNER